MTDFFVPSTWRRLVAKGIDSIFIWICCLPFIKTFYLLIFTDEPVQVSLWRYILFLFIPSLYEFVFLVLMQATPGKWLMGLKVVPFSDPHQPLTLEHCVLRPLVEKFTLLFSWAVYAAAFFRYDRTHVADWVAETRVVQFVPRPRRTKIRWILGAFLVVIYASEGLRTSKQLLQLIDWENKTIDLRAAFDTESMEDLMDEYEDL